jgi:hypothetical protein
LKRETVGFLVDNSETQQTEEKKKGASPQTLKLDCVPMEPKDPSLDISLQYKNSTVEKEKEFTIRMTTQKGNRLKRTKGNFVLKPDIRTQRHTTASEKTVGVPIPVSVCHLARDTASSSWRRAAIAAEDRPKFSHRSSFAPSDKAASPEKPTGFRV